MDIGSNKRISGITLLEIVVVVAIVGVVAAAATPYLGRWNDNQQASSVARSLAGMLTLARADAMRTGSNHLVLFSIDGISTQDASGNAIENVNGDSVTAVVTRDMFSGAENCALNSGDQRTALAVVPDFEWGVSFASSRAPLDNQLPAISGGSTFARPAVPNTALNGLLFGPTGVPVTFNANGGGCLTIDSVGSGGGALYITNGTRDYAIVQTPLGGNRVHVWRAESSAWTP